MRLTVKKGDSIIDEFNCSEGPVYIGRHVKSQILLADQAVSRHHAVIFSTQDGRWIIEDLDSANETHLNGRPIHKEQLKDGDQIRIVDFTIDVELAEKAPAEPPVDPGDTLTTAVHGPQTIIRKADAEHACPINLPARRVKDFIEATELICKANGPEELLRALLQVATKQFVAFHMWCALRIRPEGPMVSAAGKKRDGTPVRLEDIKLQERISEAVERKQFFLFQRIPSQLGEERIRSAMIAPLINRTGCFGVVYIDNAMDHETYALSDLDYLMLLAIHTAAIVENF